MIRLLVVDDHVQTREQAVTDLSSGGLINVVGQAGTSDEAYKACAQLLPDIVLLDLHLPGLIGTFDLIKKLTSLKMVRVVIFARPEQSIGGPRFARCRGCRLRSQNRSASIVAHDNRDGP